MDVELGTTLMFIDYLIRHLTTVLTVHPDDVDGLIQRIREELDANSSLTHTQRKQLRTIIEKLLAAN
jgi:hypothetical protein